MLQVVCWPITEVSVLCVVAKGWSVVGGKGKITECTGVFSAEMSQDTTFNSLLNLDLCSITVNPKCRKK